MLYAIADSGTHSDVVFQSTRQALKDPDANVQQIALQAVVKTGPDQTAIVTALQSVQSSDSADPTTKKHAQAILNSMGK